jgi:hypothetical protein
MKAGLESFVYVRVYDSVDPVTVASKWPVLGLNFGVTSWKPLSFACIDRVASSALVAATVNPRTATTAAARKIHLTFI